MIYYAWHEHGQIMINRISNITIHNDYAKAFSRQHFKQKTGIETTLVSLHSKTQRVQQKNWD